MSHVLRIGVVDQIAYFRAYNTDGSGKADLTSATTGLTLSVFRVGLASVSIASLTNKAADNTTHADGAIRNVGGNLYTVDLPDAATADQTPSIGVRGTYTGGVIEPIPHPIVNYNPALVAVGANTVTPLDSTQTQTAVAAAISGRGDSSPVVRDVSDTQPITFLWPTSGASFTVRRAINNGAFADAAGSITFLRQEGSRYRYSFGYNAADRPASSGIAVYEMTSGSTIDFISLRIESSTAAEADRVIAAIPVEEGLSAL